MTKAKEMRELTSGIDVDANGNVGIGTNSPSELFHTNGSIRLTTDVSTTRRLYALSGTGTYALNSSGGAAIAFHRDATNNDEIAFETHWQGNQHAERMRIDNQGNVGIGTTSPGAKLEVNAGSTTGTHSQIVTTGSGHNFDMTDGTSTARMRNVAGRLHLIADANNEAADSEIRFLVDNDQKMKIDKDGNVGIGETDPAGKLEVQNTSVNYAILGTSNNGHYFESQSDDNTDGFEIYQQHGSTTTRNSFIVNDNRTGSKSAALVVRGDGNVGIGTSTPDTILEIVSSNPILTLRDTGTGFNNGDATLRLAESGAGDTLGGYFDVRLDASMLKFDFTPEGGSVSTYMAINSSDGNVGIGTADPVSKLDIRGGVVNVGYDSTGGVTYVQKTFSTIHAAGNRTGDIAFGLVDGSFGGMIARNVLGSNASFNSQHLEFHTHNGGINAGERMRIDYTGNVGIGTSSPQRKIHSVDSNGQVLRLQRDGAFTGSWDLSIGTQTTGDFTVYDNENSQRAITVEKLTGFSGTSAMYIDSNGRVGIGTASPSATLDVSDSTLSTTRTTSGSYHLTGYQYATGFAYLLTNGQFEIGTSGPHVNIFKTNNTERLRITTAGDLMVGTTSTGGGRCVIETTSTNQLVLSNKDTGADAQYAAYFLRNNSIVGSIQTSNTSSSFVTSSDYRLKENVTDVTDGITRVKQLEPKRFNFIADPDKTVDGFLAHEAQAVVPEAVTGTQDAMRDEEYEVTPAVLDENGNEVTPAVMGTRSVPDYQGIDQSKLVPLLTAALKESIAKIEALEARVTALES